MDTPLSLCKGMGLHQFGISVDVATILRRRAVHPKPTHVKFTIQLCVGNIELINVAFYWQLDVASSFTSLDCMCRNIKPCNSGHG